MKPSDQHRITKANLAEHLKSGTDQLLEMAADHAWNEISSAVCYVIKKVRTGVTEGINVFETNRIRKKLLQSMKAVDLSSAVAELRSIFDDIYLIELYIFRADTSRTIIEIEILEKAEVASDPNSSNSAKGPTLHCKVPIPPYVADKQKGRFDINWQLETPEYRRKMLWWKLKQMISP